MLLVWPGRMERNLKSQLNVTLKIKCPENLASDRLTKGSRRVPPKRGEDKREWRL